MICISMNSATHLIEPPHVGLKGEQRLKTDQLLLQQARAKSLKMQLHTTQIMSLWTVTFELHVCGQRCQGGIVGLKIIQDI